MLYCTHSCMEYGPIMWCMTSHTDAHMPHNKLLHILSHALEYAWCRVLVVCSEYQCYFREGKAKFNKKCRVLLYEVEAADSICECFTARSRHSTIKTTVYLPVFKRKHCHRYIFTQNRWKIQIQWLNYPRKHSFNLTWSRSTRVHKRKLVMVGATHSHRRARKIFSP